MARRTKTKVFDTLTITASSGAIQSLATILGTTDWPAVDDHANKHQIVEVWLTASADFYFGNSSTHADKVLADVSATPIWKREGDGNLITGTYVRAYADSAITGATVEIHYGV